jgi:alpha-L-fucosidase
MKTKIVLSVFLILFLSAGQVASQLNTETKEQKAERMKWWTDARFGMFIHWGLYSMPARHEWVRNYEQITNEQYQKYFDLFDPDLFNPREWAKNAKAAGMKYFVITTKHHEGFCLWNSKYTDYKATNTPAKRDLRVRWSMPSGLKASE